jgi:hypothetical protein
MTKTCQKSDMIEIKTVLIEFAGVLVELHYEYGCAKKSFSEFEICVLLCMYLAAR